MINKAIIEHYYERNNVSHRFGTPFAKYRENYSAILQDYCSNIVIQNKGWRVCVDGACDDFVRDATKIQNKYLGYGVRTLQKFWELNRKHTNFYVLGFQDSRDAVVVLDYDLDTPFLMDATVVHDLYDFDLGLLKFSPLTSSVSENAEYADILRASNFYDEPMNSKGFFTNIYQHYYDIILASANEADYVIQTCETLLEMSDDEIESQRDAIITQLEQLAYSHWSLYRSHSGTPDGLLQISSTIVDAYFGRKGSYEKRVRNTCDVLLRALRVFALDDTGRADSNFSAETALFVVNNDTYKYFVDPVATSYYDATMGGVDAERVKEHLGKIYDTLGDSVDVDTSEPFAIQDDDIVLDMNEIACNSQKNVSLMESLVQSVTKGSSQRVVLKSLNKCMCIGTCAELHDKCQNRTQLLKWLLEQFDVLHNKTLTLSRVLMNTPIGFQSDEPDVSNLHVDICHSVRYLSRLRVAGKVLSREEYIEHGWRYYLAYSYCTRFQAVVRNSVETALRTGGVCELAVTSSYNSVADMVFMLDEQSGKVPAVFKTLHESSAYNKMDSGLYEVVSNTRKLLRKEQRNKTYVSPVAHFKFEPKHMGKIERGVLDLSDVIGVVAHILNMCTETDRLSDIVPFRKLTGKGFMSLCRLIAWAILALDYSAFTMMHNYSYLGTNRKAMANAFLDELVLTEEAKARIAI